MGIYLFQHRTKPFLKVGVHSSLNPWNRLANGFQGNICPAGLDKEPYTAYDLKGWFAALGYTEEAAVHAAFRATRLCGEWWPASDFAKIYQAVAVYGSPDTAYLFTAPMEEPATLRILVAYDLPLEKKDFMLSLLPQPATLRQLGATETRFVTATDSPLMKAIAAAEEAASKPEPKKRWTVWRPCDDQRLNDLFAEGRSLEEIGADLGRTARAITMRLKGRIQAAIQADGMAAAKERFSDPRLEPIWESL